MQYKMNCFTEYLYFNTCKRKELINITSTLANLLSKSNIAEGFGRTSPKEKIQFYKISLSSLAEVQNQLLVSRDINFISSKFFSESAEQTVIVSKLLNGLIKYTKSLLQNT